MDRSALSVAAPLVVKDLRLDAARLGIIVSSFFGVYAVFTLIGGDASNLFGPKRVFTLSMSPWSVFYGLTAATVAFSSLLVVRVLFGCGEGPFSAAANKMVSNWFSPRQIANSKGVANAGTAIDGALAGTLAGLARRALWLAHIVCRTRGDRSFWTLCWALAVTDRPAMQQGQRDLEGLKEEHRYLAEQHETSRLCRSIFGSAL